MPMHPPIKSPARNQSSVAILFFPFCRLFHREALDASVLLQVLVLILGLLLFGLLFLIGDKLIKRTPTGRDNTVIGFCCSEPCEQSVTLISCEERIEPMAVETGPS